jgi:hypothetical protein
MLIDGNSPVANPAPAGQPTPTQATTAAEPLADNAAEPDTAPMSDFLANNEEYHNTLNDPNAGNPLDRYLRADMPTIHDAHPTAAFDFIDAKTIKDWDSFPTFKLIATPFGIEARQQLKHNGIRMRILAAVAEITKSRQAGVSAPGPTDRIIKARRRTPRAFLIHSLTKDQYLLLTKRKIWVSPDVAFRVTPTSPTCPDFLFTLTELSSLDPNEVSKMVKTIWQQETNLATIREIIQNTCPAPMNHLLNLPEFIATAWVEYLEIKEDGGRLTPQYNVYAPGGLFPDYRVWTKVRGYLARIPYNTVLLGNGIAKPALYHCNLCHAADHPRGLCRFPLIPEWPGPSGLPENAH